MPDKKRILITRLLPPAVMTRAKRDYDFVENDDDHIMEKQKILDKAAGGDLVVDEDVIAALKSGQLKAAGLDVYAGEPNIHEDYYALENAFLLPHMGTPTIEARNEMGFAALDNIDAVLAGRAPIYPVV